MKIPMQITYLWEFNRSDLTIHHEAVSRKASNGRVISVLLLPLQRPIHPPIIKVLGKKKYYYSSSYTV
jgi:hypothetical protein